MWQTAYQQRDDVRKRNRHLKREIYHAKMAIAARKATANATREQVLLEEALKELNEELT